MGLPPNPRIVSAEGHSVPPRGHEAALRRLPLPLPPRRRLVVVDAHGHAFRAFWALEPMHAPDGLPTNALFGLAGLLRRIVLEERPDYLAVVFDAADDVRRTFRSALYPAYKAHRPERPEDLAKQMPLLRDVARALELTILEHPDFEADDLIATVVGMAEADDVDTTIMSADKDLLQLVSDRTLVWDAMRGKRYTQTGVRDKLGVGPAMVADYLALCGDTSDNVPGVPGIGPKGAAGLLRAYGTLEAVYAALEQIPARERKKLDEHRERAFLSQSLTRLRKDVPIGCALNGLRLPAARPELGAELWARLGFASFLPGAARHRRADEHEAWEAERRETPVRAKAELELGGPRGAVAAGDDTQLVAEAAVPVEPGLDGPGEIDDIEGLMTALGAARAAMAIGLAMVGDAVMVKPIARGKRPEPIAASEPPVLGLALPTGAAWRIKVRGAHYGLPVQGSLFGVAEREIGIALADVAAAIGSLLADPRRVLCVHDGRRLLPVLGIEAARAALDAREATAADAAGIALEALSSWLERSAATA